MQEPQPKSSARKLLRVFGLSALVLIVILWVVLAFVMPPQQDAPLPADSGQDGTVSQTPEAYPEAAKFTRGYFDQVQRGNYAALLREYWLPTVPDDIQRQCASPLEEGTLLGAEELWRKCGFFNRVTVSIVSAVETENGYLVTVQFADNDGSIVGSTLHPEWTMGHEIVIERTPDGLKTGDWYFLN